MLCQGTLKSNFLEIYDFRITNADNMAKIGKMSTFYSMSTILPHHLSPIPAQHQEEPNSLPCMHGGPVTDSNLKSGMRLRSQSALANIRDCRKTFEDSLVHIGFHPIHKWSELSVKKKFTLLSHEGLVPPHSQTHDQFLFLLLLPENHI